MKKKKTITPHNLKILTSEKSSPVITRDLSKGKDYREFLETLSNSISLEETVMNFSSATLNNVLSHPNKLKTINHYNENGLTPLHISIMLRRYQVVETLIKKGANVNQPTKRTADEAKNDILFPLEIAALKESEKLIPFRRSGEKNSITSHLIEKGANPCINKNNLNLLLVRLANKKSWDEDIAPLLMRSVSILYELKYDDEKERLKKFSNSLLKRHQSIKIKNRKQKSFKRRCINQKNHSRHI